MKEYTVISESGKRNWSAYVPDLPGCVATGDTLSETEQMILEAIDFHLEGMAAHGEPIPDPTTLVGFVNVAAPNESERPLASANGK